MRDAARPARPHAGLLLVAGAVAGAMIAYFLVPRAETAILSGAVLPADNLDAPGLVAISRAGSISAERMVTYRAIMEIDDADELEKRLERLAPQPTSSSREFELDVLLARLAALDAEHTITIARRLSVNDDFFAKAATHLAASRSAALIEALRSIQDPVTARRAALGALATLGYDNGWIDRLAAALPAPEGRRLRLEALEDKVSVDPYGAFQAANALDEPLREAALRGVAIAWAERDAPAAARALSLVPTDERLFVTREVFAIWARRDLGAVARFLEREASITISEVSGLLEDLSKAYPDSAQIILARMPVSYRHSFDGDR